MSEIVVVFNKGETYLLDEIMRYQSILPIESYEQDDIADWTWTNDNDAGETVRFLKTVRLEIKITITG